MVDNTVRINRPVQRGPTRTDACGRSGGERGSLRERHRLAQAGDVGRALAP